MSHDLFLYNTEQLAGPSCTTTPLPCVSPSYRIDLPSNPLTHGQREPCGSYIVQRNSTLHGSGHDSFLQCGLRPLFRLPSHGNDATGKTTYNSHQFPSNSSLLMDSPSISAIDPVDTSMQRYIPKGEDSNSHCDPRITWSSFHNRQASSSFCQLSPSLTPQEAVEPSECSQVITPKLQHAEDLNAPLPQPLSPYAPMPLPPIFYLESQSRIHHPPIDPVPSSYPPFWHGEEGESPPTDPVLLPARRDTEKEVAAELATTPLARGSTASGCLWPPSLPLQSQPTFQQDFCPYSAADIPLELARRHARENRTLDPNGQLSLSFLLSFMGQANGQPPWSCYIRDCGKQLIRKSHMVDHIRMHLDERVYVCEHCPQTFLRKADCKRHSAAHNPEKAFQCNLCIKSFGRKDLLTRHKRKCEQNYNTGEGGARNITERPRKRKGLQGKSIFNSRGSQSMLSMPSLDFNKNNNFTLESDGANKENIPPDLWPGGLLVKFSYGQC